MFSFQLDSTLNTVYFCPHNIFQPAGNEKLPKLTKNRILNFLVKSGDISVEGNSHHTPDNEWKK